MFPGSCSPHGESAVSARGKEKWMGKIGVFFRWKSRKGKRGMLEIILKFNKHGMDGIIFDWGRSVIKFDENMKESMWN